MPPAPLPSHPLTTHLITHTDADGLGCEVMVRSVRDAVRSRRVEVDAVGGAVIELLEELDRAPAGAAEVIVTDHHLSPSAVAAADAYAERGGVFRVLDHHKTSLDLVRHSWATVDTSRCATLLCFEELHAPGRYRAFAGLVNDTDLGIWADSRSSELATLSVTLPGDAFVERFLGDPDCGAWRPEEQALIQWENRRLREYVVACEGAVRVVERDGLRVGVIFAEDFKNAVARHLMEKMDLDVVAQINARTGKVGLRGNRRVDLSEIAARHGGGGHPGAAAFGLGGSEAGALLAGVLDRFGATLIADRGVADRL
ncbi:MAG: hypothetical protein ACREPA_11220 [Candidatus Dormibacteraceae bacterium]